jgi:hypothetical protein
MASVGWESKGEVTCSWETDEFVLAAEEEEEFPIS